MIFANIRLFPTFQKNIGNYFSSAFENTDPESPLSDVLYLKRVGNHCTLFSAILPCKGLCYSLMSVYIGMIIHLLYNPQKGRKSTCFFLDDTDYQTPVKHNFTM